MIDFSIIIPIYNAQKTLRRCLDSILAQSSNNYEVLLMDDGSNDESYQICLEYQRKDTRFKVYHQENKGPSTARNKCLDIAKGEWVCFVDSDDSVSKDYLEQIHNVVINDNPEVIFIGYQQINETNGEITVKRPISHSENKYEKLIDLSRQDMFGYTWIKSIKRDVIGSIRFPLDLNLFEDEVFTCEVLKHCENVGILQYPIYNYWIGNENALTQAVYDDYCNKCERVFDAWEFLLVKYENQESFMQEKANRLVEQCRYYGFERDIKLKKFFADLANTKYFSQHSQVSRFDKFVQEHNFVKILFEKKKYLMKIKISELIRK